MSTCLAFTYEIDCTGNTLEWIKYDAVSGLEIARVSLLKSTSVIKENPEQGNIQITGFNTKHELETITLYEGETYAGCVATGVIADYEGECSETITLTQAYVDLLACATACVDLCNCP